MSDIESSDLTEPCPPDSLKCNARLESEFLIVILI